jgi:hypothetical protein
MNHERARDVFRREAMEVYERPLESATPELLIPWRGWCVWLAAALIAAGVLVWKL